MLYWKLYFPNFGCSLLCSLCGWRLSLFLLSTLLSVCLQCPLFCNRSVLHHCNCIHCSWLRNGTQPFQNFPFVFLELTGCFAFPNLPSDFSQVRVHWRICFSPSLPSLPLVSISCSHICQGLPHCFLHFSGGLPCVLDSWGSRQPFIMASGAGVTGAYEPPDASVGNWAGVTWKSNGCFAAAEPSLQPQARFSISTNGLSVSLWFIFAEWQEPCPAHQASLLSCGPCFHRAHPWQFLGKRARLKVAAVSTILTGDF